jgi:dipeptidase
VLFAKNSDRERNEAQFLEITPAARYARGSKLRSTYITIPQAERTHACLLSRPYWMWGAEMGANEHGVVIGNEAIHSHIQAPRRRALIGMDLVRLGLERGADAESATQIIIDLLERHDQGGDCGHLGRFYYHNSFLIADRRQAFVLETVGRWWAVEKVKDTRAISNAVSIGRDPERISMALAGHADREGWLDKAGRFDFAARLIDKPGDAVSFGRGRCARATGLLERDAGALTPAGMMTILRDHGVESEDNPDWSPADTRGRTLCMHAAEGARRSQTTASMVSELGREADVHWVTATAAPCLSLFKPVLFETGLPDQGRVPLGSFDGASRWWGHEEFHRAVLQDYPRRAESIRAERDALELNFTQRMDVALGRGRTALRGAVRDCWREADAAEQRWRAAVTGLPAPEIPYGAYRRSWARLGQAARMPRIPRARTSRHFGEPDRRPGLEGGLLHS